MKSAERFHCGAGRSPAATPTCSGPQSAKVGSPAAARVASTIARTVSSLVRPPAVGLSPYTNRKRRTP